MADERGRAVADYATAFPLGGAMLGIILKNGRDTMANYVACWALGLWSLMVVLYFLSNQLPEPAPPGEEEWKHYFRNAARGITSILACFIGVLAVVATNKALAAA